MLESDRWIGYTLTKEDKPMTDIELDIVLSLAESEETEKKEEGEESED